MYFDYAATTPPRDEVLETFDAANRSFWANPESLHRPGLRAESMLESARERTLDLLGAAKGYRCVFTSGATESNNMAIVGVAKDRADRGKHLITSAIEHPAVLKVMRGQEEEGWELDVLPVNAEGRVESADLEKALRADTTLVSIMHVNNEIGSINRIDELGALIKAKSRALFHVDAAQSVGKLPIALNELEVDLLSFSAHKFFGLKGSGALIFRNGVELAPLMRGGGQEDGLRAGTADPARAAALAKALRLADEERVEAYARCAEFKARVWETLSRISGAELNGSLENASPFVLNVSIPGPKPETILQALAEKEIYISTVSACSTRKSAESAVVRALTGDARRAGSCVRFSFAARTTEAEVETLRETIGPLIDSLRVKS